MTVYRQETALKLLTQEKIPLNSIGFFETKEGWTYWFYNQRVFDIGVAKTEKEAFEIALKNYI
jgi:hypothetical protein